MYRFDFTKSEYDFILDQCPFTDEEKKIFEMRRSGNYTVDEISNKLFLHPRTVKRRIKSIQNKILKVI